MATQVPINSLAKKLNNKSYFSENTLLVNLFNRLFQISSHVIPPEKLDVESVFYWAWVCSKCKNIQGSERKKNALDAESENADNDRTVPQGGDKTTQIESEDNLDRILPSLTEFCDYATKFFRAYDQEREKRPDDEKLQIETTFITKQLFKIFLYTDFSDKHGKKTLVQFCEQLFADKNYEYLFEAVMKVYKILIPNLQQRINKLVELISDLKEPPEREEEDVTVRQSNATEMLRSEILESASSLAGSNLEPAANGVVPKTKLEISLQISELKFKRYKLKDDFEKMCQDMKCVDKQVDMAKVSELRDDIKKCEDEIAALQIQLNNPQPTENVVCASGGGETLMPNGSQYGFFICIVYYF